jgi:hypothetical protein
MIQTPETTPLLHGGLFRPSMFECGWLFEVVRPAGKIRKFPSMIRERIARLNIDVKGRQDSRDGNPAFLQIGFKNGDGAHGETISARRTRKL